MRPVSTGRSHQRGSNDDDEERLPLCEVCQPGVRVRRQSCGHGEGRVLLRGNLPVRRRMQVPAELRVSGFAGTLNDRERAGRCRHW